MNTVQTMMMLTFLSIGACSELSSVSPLQIDRAFDTIEVGDKLTQKQTIQKCGIPDQTKEVDLLLAVAKNYKWYSRMTRSEYTITIVNNTVIHKSKNPSSMK